MPRAGRRRPRPRADRGGPGERDDVGGSTTACAGLRRRPVTTCSSPSGSSSCEQLGQPQSPQASASGHGLSSTGVAEGERRRGLPQRDRQREVPRRDQPGDAVRRRRVRSRRLSPARRVASRRPGRRPAARSSPGWPPPVHLAAGLAAGLPTSRTMRSASACGPLAQPAPPPRAGPRRVPAGPSRHQPAWAVRERAASARTSSGDTAARSATRSPGHCGERLDHLGHHRKPAGNGSSGSRILRGAGDPGPPGDGGHHRRAAPPTVVSSTSRPTNRVPRKDSLTKSGRSGSSPARVQLRHPGRGAGAAGRPVEPARVDRHRVPRVAGVRARARPGRRGGSR